MNAMIDEVTVFTLFVFLGKLAIAAFLLWLAIGIAGNLLELLFLGFRRIARNPTIVVLSVAVLVTALAVWEVLDRGVSLLDVPSAFAEAWRAKGY
jgi:hypothetical protein